MSRLRSKIYIGHAILIVVFASMARLFWGCFAEDSFIVARYASNVLHGNGLVYNVGEKINVLTSPIHALVLIPIQAVFLNAIKGYTILCAIGMAILAIFSSRYLFREPAQQWMFIACTFLFPPLCFWTVGGLETPILTALALGLILAWNSAPSIRSAALILVFCAAAVLTRYDALLLVGPVAVHTLISSRTEPLAWITAALLCAVGISWFFISYAYFGDLLPTSFYIKDPAHWSIRDVLHGALYEANFLLLLSCPVALAFLFGCRRVSPGSSIASGGRPVWPLLAGLSLYFLYGLTAGTVHMMYLYRLFVPCVPWLTVICMNYARLMPTVLGLIAAVSFQIGIASVVYFRAMNFNITLLFSKQSPFHEAFEFSTVGAVANKQTDKVFAAQARDLRQHWRKQPESARGGIPRLHSITEGQPPYEAQDFFVYGPLVSYRHVCRLDTMAASHYLQHITWVTPQGVVLSPWKTPPWQLVTSRDTPIVEWNGEKASIRIEWFYRPNPEPNKLPPTLNAPCL
jgi:hypothetical protein